MLLTKAKKTMQCGAEVNSMFDGLVATNTYFGLRTVLCPQCGKPVDLDRTGQIYPHNQTICSTTKGMRMKKFPSLGIVGLIIWLSVEGALLYTYGIGVVYGFKHSLVLGLVSLLPPVGFIEGLLYLLGVLQ